MKGKSRLITLISVVLLFACNHKKKFSLSGEEPVDIRDFIESFQSLAVPYEMADTSVSKKAGDTLRISHQVFSRLVPDSILNKVFAKEENPKIYPVGRMTAPNKGTYLLVKALSANHRAVFILCFDKRNNFIAGMPALQPDANPATRQFFSVDKRYTLSKSITRKNSNGSTSDGKDVYVLNEDSKSFLLIMTDALDEQKVELINPIEALPKKNKYSGDYVKDKRNLVSIRDNKRPNHMTFFVHFEEKNNCSGELKGDAAFTSNNTAVYRSDGDICVLQFKFTTSSVSITELKGCGSHRGVECVFEGNFYKKKEPARKDTKKPKKSLTR
jgi:hypothetical protein